MNKIIFLIFAVLLCFVAFAAAKRIYVKYPDSVIADGIEYKSTYKGGWLFHDAFMEATETNSNKKIWKKKIYSTLMNPIIEEDAQWVLIISVVLKDGKLLIENEKNRHYILDIKTQKLVKE
jgi:hypothetical protein